MTTITGVSGSKLDIGTLVVSITGDLSKLQKTVEESRQTLQKLEEKSKKTQTVFDMMGGSAAKVIAGITGITSAVGLAVIGFRKLTSAISNSITITASFTREMNVVKVVSAATEDQFQRMTAIAREMGRTTEFTGTQSAQALKFLTMAGLGAERSIKALPQMLDMATAGQMDLGRAADIATNIMSQMGIEVEKLNEVSDILVKTQSTANTNINEAAEAFIYAGSKARSFGVNTVQLAAYIGLLANQGIKGSMAGTTLRQSMMALLAPTEDARNILKYYGIEIEKVNKITGKSEGLRSFNDILLDLADANLDAIEITKLFGARAGNIELILNQGSAAIKRYISVVDDSKGVSKKAAETIRNDLQGAFDSLKSKTEALSESIGNNLSKVLIDASEHLGNVADNVRDSLEPLNQVSAVIDTVYKAVKKFNEFRDNNPILSTINSIFGIFSPANSGGLSKTFDDLKTLIFGGEEVNRGNPYRTEPAMGESAMSIKQITELYKDRILTLKQLQVMVKAGALTPGQFKGITKGHYRVEDSDAKDKAKEIENINKDLTEKIKQLSLSEINFEKWKLEQKVEEYKKAGASIVKIEEYNELEIAAINKRQSEEIKKRNEERLESEKQYFDQLSKKEKERANQRKKLEIEIMELSGNDLGAALARIDEETRLLEEQNPLLTDLIDKWRQLNVEKAKIENSKDAITGIKTSLKSLWEESTNYAQIAGDTVTSTVNGMASAFSNWTTTGIFDFKNFANSIISDLTRIAAKWAIMQVINGVIGSGISATGGGTLGTISSGTGTFTPSAKGNAFDNGKIIPFANGTIIGSPTYFGLNNRIGVAGEAGPEAILPLARGTDGKLGIKGNRGGNININMTINTNDAKSFEKSKDQIFSQLRYQMARVGRNS